MFKIYFIIKIMITISIKAAEKLKYFLQKESDDKDSIKIEVVAGGCSGLSHKIEYFHSQESVETDLVVEQHGLKVIMPVKSQLYLLGTTLDYSDGLNGKGFEFVNEDHKKCSCGTSFRV